MAKVILVTGSQGIGKTTWIKSELENAPLSIHLEINSIDDILKAVKSKSKNTYYLESNSVQYSDIPTKLMSKIHTIHIFRQRMVIYNGSDYSVFDYDGDFLPF